MDCFAGWADSIDGGRDSHLRLFIVGLWMKSPYYYGRPPTVFPTVIEKDAAPLKAAGISVN
jgi:hypothetical protein